MEVQKSGEFLRVLLYIEECIILLSILTSLGMIFQTRKVTQRLITKQKGGLNIVTPHYDYSWEVRDRSLKSCIGYFTLTIGAINYAFSMYLID